VRFHRIEGRGVKGASLSPRRRGQRYEIAERRFGINPVPDAGSICKKQLRRRKGGEMRFHQRGRSTAGGASLSPRRRGQR
jgi:hypothetical protein